MQKHTPSGTLRDSKEVIIYPHSKKIAQLEGALTALRDEVYRLRFKLSLNIEDIVVTPWGSEHISSWSIGCPKGVQIVHKPTGIVVQRR